MLSKGSNSRNFYLLHIVFGLIVIGLDQASKFFGLHLLQTASSFDVLPILKIKLDMNYGYALGFLSSLGIYSQLAMVLITLPLLGILFTMVHKKSHTAYKHAIGEVLIIAGGISNSIDRLYHGFVVDLFNWHIGATYWPASVNLADMFIVGGVFLLFVGLTE